MRSMKSSLKLSPGLVVGLVLFSALGVEAVQLRQGVRKFRELHDPKSSSVGVEGADWDISAENKALYDDQERFVFTCTGTEAKAPKTFPSKFLECCQPVHWLIPRKLDADKDSIKDSDLSADYARAHDAGLEWLQQQVLRDPFETYSRECLEAITEVKCLGFRRCDGDNVQHVCAKSCNYVQKVCAKHMDAIIFPAFKDCNNTEFWDQGNENCLTREALGGDAWEVPDRCVAPQDLRHKDIAAFEENKENALAGFKPGDDELTEEKALEVVHALQNLLVHIFSVSYHGAQDGWVRDTVNDANGIHQEVVSKEDEVWELEETLKQYLSDIDAMMSDSANKNIMDMLQTAQSHVAAAISHLDIAAEHRAEFGHHLANMIMKSRIPHKLPKPINKLPSTIPLSKMPAQEAASNAAAPTEKGEKKPGSPSIKTPKQAGAGSLAVTPSPVEPVDSPSSGSGNNQGDVRNLGELDPPDRFSGQGESEGTSRNEENVDGMDRPEATVSSGASNSESGIPGSKGSSATGSQANSPGSATEPSLSKIIQISNAVLKGLNEERAKCLPVPLTNIVQVFPVTQPVLVEKNSWSVHVSFGQGVTKVMYEDNDSSIDQLKFDPSPCQLDSNQGDGVTEIGTEEVDVKNAAAAAINLFNSARGNCAPTRKPIDPTTVVLEASEVQIVRGRIVYLQLRMTDPETKSVFIQKLQLWYKPDGSMVLEAGDPGLCGGSDPAPALDETVKAATPSKAIEHSMHTWDRRFYDQFHGPDRALPTLSMSEAMWTIASQENDDEDIPMTVIEDLPDSFDIRQGENTKECVRGPGNQGVCGSCWAFSSTFVLAERYCVQSGGKINVHLSPQDALECNTMPGAMHCCGGQPYESWQFLSQVGVREERCVPYKDSGTVCPMSGSGGMQNKIQRTCLETFSDKSCVRYRAVGGMSGAAAGSRVKRQGRLAKREDYVARKSSTFTRDLNADTPEYRELERIVMTAIYQGGSVEGSMVVHPDLFSYKGGVYQTAGSERGGGHMVKIVGWGVEKGMKYWTVQNSWGTNWGEAGFFRIRRGVNECRIEDMFRWADPLRTCKNDCTGRGLCNNGATVNDAGSCQCAVGFTGEECGTITLDHMNPANSYWTNAKDGESVMMQSIDNRLTSGTLTPESKAQIDFCGKKESNTKGFDLVNRYCGAKVAVGGDCSADCKKYLEEHITRMKTCGTKAADFLVWGNRPATLMVKQCGLMSALGVSLGQFQAVRSRRRGAGSQSSNDNSSYSSSSSSAGAAIPKAGWLVLTALIALILLF